MVDKFIYYRTTFHSDNDKQETSWKLFVPESMRKLVIISAHDQPSSSHCGMVVDVRNYIRNCNVCKTTKHPTSLLRPPMGKRVQRLYMDFIGPFPRTKSGNIGIFIILDHFSKFTFLKPVKKFNSKIIISFLKDEIFSCFGVPEVVVSDNGTQFKSREFSDFLSKYGIHHTFTGAYAPQSNAAERVNRSINAALRAYLRSDQREWDKYLSSINSSLRNCIHQSIGMSPYLAVFGQNKISHGKDYKLLRNLGMLTEGEIQLSKSDECSKIRSTIGKYLQKAHQTNEKTYNLRSRERSFDVGQEVIKRNFALSSAANYINAKLAPLNGKELGKFHAKDIW